MERREFRAYNRAGGWIVNVIAAALLLLILVGPPIIGQALLARGMAPWLYSIFVALAGFIPVLSQNWEIYRKIWHAARIAAGHLIYILFAPFNHSRHILPRLTVFWLLGVLLAIPGGKWLLEDRATSPLADEWLNDAARFVSEDALEPRSGAKALPLLRRADPIGPMLEARYPATRRLRRALSALYDNSGDSTGFADSVASAVHTLSLTGRTSRGLDGAISELLLLRMLIWQSKQGSKMAPILEALDVMEGRGAVWEIPPPVGRTKPATVHARQQWRNLRGGIDRFCAENHDVYKTRCEMKGITCLSAEALYLRAEKSFTAAAQAPSESTLTRLRGLNNHADLVLARVASLGHGRSRGRADGAATPPSLAPDGEEKLIDLRDKITALLSVRPEPTYMMTVAQISCALAHAGMQQYVLDAAAGEKNHARLSDIQQDLAKTTKYLEMALSLGADPRRFKVAPHARRLCVLLSFDLCSQGFPDELVQLGLEEQRRALAMMEGHGISFACQECENRWKNAQIRSRS